MTVEEFRKSNELIDTGKAFHGWRIYGIIRDENDSDKAYGVPTIYLVKGEEIRRPSSKEYMEVLAIANADYVND